MSFTEKSSYFYEVWPAIFLFFFCHFSLKDCTCGVLSKNFFLSSYYGGFFLKLYGFTVYIFRYIKYLELILCKIWNIITLHFLFFFKDLFIKHTMYCWARKAPGLITDGCEPPCGCSELNSGPLEEQPVLLSSEPSLQPPHTPFSCMWILLPKNAIFITKLVSGLYNIPNICMCIS